ncbi:hypothetical protein EKK58_00580 [Candidatus Dependentiae bacterium]|nr:MAG: hypothetical protein EKK58_00580 [Candidatus Dependentiae bacterium]
MKKNDSLGARIKAAKSADEIKLLLGEGSRFEYAAQKTQRRWKRLAAQRLTALATPIPSASPAVTTPTTKKASVKKNFKKKS